MLFNRLLTADWLPEIKIETQGWRNKQMEEWNENTWNWNWFLCFSDDKWERKTLRQQRAGRRREVAVFVSTAECAWSCAFNEESKQEDWKKQKKRSQKVIKKAQFAYSQCYLKTLTCLTCGQMWSVCLCVHVSRTTHEACPPENSTHSSCFGKNK